MLYSLELAMSTAIAMYTIYLPDWERHVLIVALFIWLNTVRIDVGCMMLWACVATLKYEKLRISPLSLTSFSLSFF